MILNNIEILQNLLDDRDLDALKHLNSENTKERKQNKKQNYSSVLMVSAHNIKHLNKIDELKADAIILNLEDGVSTILKPFALELSAYFLSKIKESDKKLIVRVNALDEGGFEEIKYLNAFKPDAIRVPKIRDANEVKQILASLDESIELHLSIETAEAWLNLKELAYPRVKAYYLGVLDLMADLKINQSLFTLESDISGYILSHFLLTCRALRIKAISFVFQEYKNEELFVKWLEKERLMGYETKGCLSPSQVLHVNKMFSRDDEDVNRAKEIIRLFEENRAKGITGFSHDEYGFIDEPIYKNALNTIKEG